MLQAALWAPEESPSHSDANGRQLPPARGHAKLPISSRLDIQTEQNLDSAWWNEQKLTTKLKKMVAKVRRAARAADAAA